MWTLLLLHTAAQPLATPADEARLAERLTAEVVSAEALGRAAGQALHALDPRAPCAELAEPRAHAFLEAWRVHAEAALQAADAVAALDGSPTLVPLRSDAHREAQQAWIARARRTAAAYRGAATAYPRTGRCDEPLQPSAGWPLPYPRGGDEGRATEAVWVTAAGFACPARGEPRQVAVGPLLVRGAVCWAPAADCACTVASVDPGAVLGPG
jgi:hypothetical protein